jgi:hypothetical protein
VASGDKLGAMRAAEAKCLKVYMRLVLDDSPDITKSTEAQWKRLMMRPARFRLICNSIEFECSFVAEYSRRLHKPP